MQQTAVLTLVLAHFAGCSGTASNTPPSDGAMADGALDGALDGAPAWDAAYDAGVPDGSVDLCPNQQCEDSEDCLTCPEDCGPCAPVEFCGEDCTFPAVAAAFPDRVMVVWSDYSLNPTQIIYTCFDGTDWTAPQPCHDTAPIAKDFAKIEADSQGRFHMVWHQELGASRKIMYAVFSAGQGCSGSWSTPERIDTGNINSCWPQLTVDPNDVPHVSWTEDYQQIHYSEREAGTWIPPAMVADTPAVVSCHSDIAILDGRAGIVWMESEAPRMPAFAEESETSPGTFPPHELLNTGFYGFPQIVADSTGRPHVLYCVRSGGIYHLSRDTAGQWSPHQQISSGSMYYTMSNLTFAHGSLYGAWDQLVMDTAQMFIASGDPSTGTWTAPVQVSETVVDNDAKHGMVAVDSDGRAHTVWVELPEGEERGAIYYRLMSAP